MLSYCSFRPRVAAKNLLAQFFQAPEVMMSDIVSGLAEFGGNLVEAIGAELTELRRAKGWSQQKLADRLGYDITHVRQTEMVVIRRSNFWLPSPRFSLLPFRNSFEKRRAGWSDIRTPFGRKGFHDYCP